MKPHRILAILAIVSGLGACAQVDTATRNAPALSSPLATVSANATQGRQVIKLTPQYEISQIHVSVPETLKVSEANLFFPIADIVWRGEAPGNRYSQVKAILDDSFGVGTLGMANGPKVIVEAEVTRFHSLTEKTRYTIGGVHSVRFQMTVRDAASGAIVDGPRLVVADIKGSGGSAAIEEERMGRTQRVVIVEQLSQVIRRELSRQTLVTPEAVTSRLDSNLRLSPVAGMR